MPESIVYKLFGPTTLLSVINGSHSPVTVSSAQNEVSNYAAFTNIGGAPITVTVFPINSSPPTMVHPTDGTSQPGFLIPPLMQKPMLVAVPSGGFQVTAISNSATASSLYITPAGDI